MVYEVVTISVPHELCQKMIRGTETMSDVFDAYDIIKKQVRKDETERALAHPFHTALERPSLDQSMIDADVHDSRPYDSCMGIFEGYEKYDQDELISEDEYNYRGPGC